MQSIIENLAFTEEIWIWNQKIKFKIAAQFPPTYVSLGNCIILSLRYLN